MPKGIKKIKGYIVNLLMCGNVYVGKGDTLDSALENLGLSWEQIKGKGVITVIKDGKTMEHLYYVKQLKRMFANKLARFTIAKRLELLFKEKLCK